MATGARTAHQNAVSRAAARVRSLETKETGQRALVQECWEELATPDPTGGSGPLIAPHVRQR